MAEDALLELLKKSCDLPDEAFRSISTYVKDKRYGTAQLLRVYGKLFLEPRYGRSHRPTNGQRLARTDPEECRTGRKEWRTS